MSTDFTRFTETVKAGMSRHLKDYDITDVVVTKLNDIKLQGIVARHMGENAGATIYLDGAFKDYTNGEDLESIIDSMVDVVRYADVHRPAATNMDITFDSIRDDLSLRLIDTELNREYLTEHPHREIGAGLAVVADVDMGDGYRFVITDSIAEDYDETILFDTAMQNMVSKHRAKLQSLEGALFGEDRNLLDEGFRHIEGMHTLMLEGMDCFGACVLAYEGVAEQIREMYGGDYFILPSSLHEVILVGDDGSMRGEDLKQMVMQANRTVVEPSDVLSDSVFHFGAKGLQRVI